VARRVLAPRWAGRALGLLDYDLRERVPYVLASCQPRQLADIRLCDTQRIILARLLCHQTRCACLLWPLKPKVKLYQTQVAVARTWCNQPSASACGAWRCVGAACDKTWTAPVIIPVYSLSALDSQARIYIERLHIILSADDATPC
jgi:hypothetical protein